jgi:hypothetical protein
MWYSVKGGWGFSFQEQPPSFFLKPVLNSADISSGTYFLLPEVADT